MRLQDKGDIYFVEDFFSNCIAGFTKPSVAGSLPADISVILGHLPNGSSAAYMKQIHSDRVYKITSPGIYEGDGLFTQEKNMALVVKTADCLPLFFASESSGVVGVIHMGWKSAQKDILANALYNMASFKVIAGVGLRQCCFEVGEDFKSYDNFKEFVKPREGKLFFDPVGFARKKLSGKGLKPENFIDLDICSFCSKENFFSNRKDGTDNRTLSFVMKNK